MKNPRLDPEVAAQTDSKRREPPQKQPYASELDDRELEHAHSEKRPVDPKGAAAPVGETRDKT